MGGEEGERMRWVRATRLLEGEDAQNTLGDLGEEDAVGADVPV